jgi:hypothetical protein
VKRAELVADEERRVWAPSERFQHEAFEKWVKEWVRVKSWSVLLFWGRGAGEGEGRGRVLAVLEVTGGSS